MSLYKEALALADENSNDFRLDPLLNLHIHHNLAESLANTSELLQQCPSMGAHSFENIEVKNRKATVAVGKFDKYYVKRRKISEDSKSVSATQSSEQYKNPDDISPHLTGNDGDKGSGVDGQVLSRCYADDCLRRACEDIKQKYLSVFNSKLSLAQQEFKDSYMQVLILIIFASFFSFPSRLPQVFEVKVVILSSLEQLICCPCIGTGKWHLGVCH